MARSAAALAGLAEELQATAAEGQQVHVFEADLAADGAASRVMHRACNLWDRLDVLVNNAGMIGPIELPSGRMIGSSGNLRFA